MHLNATVIKCLADMAVTSSYLEANGFSFSFNIDKETVDEVFAAYLSSDYPLEPGWSISLTKKKNR